MNAKNFKTLRPRVMIGWNTGTRVIRSKRDKARSRQALNRLAREW